MPVSQSIGKAGSDSVVMFHHEQPVRHLLTALGLEDQNVQIRLNGKVFDGSLDQTFEEAGISGKDKITVLIQSYKSVVFLQQAQGFWLPNVVELLESSPEKWRGLQDSTLQPMPEKQLMTLLGLRLLREWYAKDKSEWRMIERKARGFLRQEFKMKEEEIDECLRRIVLK